MPRSALEVAAAVKRMATRPRMEAVAHPADLDAAVPAATAAAQREDVVAARRVQAADRPAARVAPERQLMAAHAAPKGSRARPPSIAAFR